MSRLSSQGVVFSTSGRVCRCFKSRMAEKGASSHKQTSLSLKGTKLMESCQTWHRLTDFKRQLHCGSRFLVVGEGIHKKAYLWETAVDALFGYSKLSFHLLPLFGGGQWVVWWLQVGRWWKSFWSKCQRELDDMNWIAFYGFTAGVLEESEIPFLCYCHEVTFIVLCPWVLLPL